MEPVRMYALVQFTQLRLEGRFARCVNTEGTVRSLND